MSERREGSHCDESFQSNPILGDMRENSVLGIPDFHTSSVNTPQAQQELILWRKKINPIYSYHPILGLASEQDTIPSNESD